MSPNGVAIIGIAGRFPGAKSLREFWENLCAGKESIRFFDEDELIAAGVPGSVRADPHYVPAAARLDDVAWFDAAFFGYTPREATVMDPQHRIFLECAWEALEEAGYAPGLYDGAIGVYAGTAVNSYLAAYAHHLGNLEGDVLATFLGNAADFLSTRVSYKLDLHGPSLTVQTACSTSLVATHLACQSLLNGECDMALAGGVSVKVTSTPGYFYQPGGIVSPDGHCRPFDARAEGTLFGDGAGVVVLKRLADAIADRDHIYAVIVGSAVNNDGASKVGYTAPSVNGQAEVVAEALAVAGVDAGTIGLLEAHGTATALGDPVEVAALTRAYRASTTRTGYCAIGSIKGNIGHLDAAAGVAGLIKAVMALHDRSLPPSVHFKEPNPEIDFAGGPFFVNAELRAWPDGPVPRRAGVSSFGMGGTNVHLILEEAPSVPQPSDHPEAAAHLLPLSARTESALPALAARYGRYFEIHPDVALSDAAYTAQLGRAHWPYRLALVVESMDQARRALADYIAGRENPRVFLAHGAESGIDDVAGADALSDLARRYVRGAEIDWSDLHPAHIRRRVSLPVYPFERQRYWLETSERVATGSAAASRSEGPSEMPAVPRSIEAAPEWERMDLMVSHVRSQVAGVLGLDSAESLDTRQGFFDLGMESLTALELKSRLESDLSCELPTTFAMNYPNVEALAAHLLGEVLDFGSTDNAGAPIGGELKDLLVNELDDLSEDDVATLLDQEVARILGDARTVADG